jgi:hypothetical protein
VTEAPTDDPPLLNPDVPGARPDRPLTAMERAVLLEAEARRRAEAPQDLPPEDGGPRGPEPTRYGDWEKKGLAIDF